MATAAEPEHRLDPVMILFGVCIAAAVTGLVVTALWVFTTDIDPAVQMPTTHQWTTWSCDDWDTADTPTRDAAVSDMVVVSGNTLDPDSVRDAVTRACTDPVNQQRPVTEFVPR